MDPDVLRHTQTQALSVMCGRLGELPEFFLLLHSMECGVKRFVPLMVLVLVGLSGVWGLTGVKLVVLLEVELSWWWCCSVVLVLLSCVGVVVELCWCCC